MGGPDSPMSPVADAKENHLMTIRNSYGQQTNVDATNLGRRAVLNAESAKYGNKEALVNNTETQSMKTERETAEAAEEEKKSKQNGVPGGMGSSSGGSSLLSSL